MQQKIYTSDSRGLELFIFVTKQRPSALPMRLEHLRVHATRATPELSPLWAAPGREYAYVRSVTGSSNFAHVVRPVDCGIGRGCC